MAPQYDEADYFYSGVAAVRMSNRKYGLIDKTGRVVVDPEFDMILSFENDGFNAIIFENPEKGINASTVSFDGKGNRIERGF